MEQKALLQKISDDQNRFIPLMEEIFKNQNEFSALQLQYLKDSAVNFQKVIDIDNSIINNCQNSIFNDFEDKATLIDVANNHKNSLKDNHSRLKATYNKIKEIEKWLV